MNELMYIRQIRPSLRNYIEKSTTAIQCSCPVCGDSSTQDWRARFYILFDREKYRYRVFCHNCGYSNSFEYFLKEFYPEVAKQMIVEDFKNRKKKPDFDISKTSSINIEVIRERNKINQYATKLIDCLDIGVLEYCEERMFNEKIMNTCYLVENFKEFNHNMGIKNGYYTQEPRIIIPFYENKILVGWQGRTIGGEGAKKYITVKYDQEKDLIFNLDNVSKSKTIFVTEGAIDSMYLTNAIATNGVTHFDNEFTRKYKNLCVLVLDSERKNQKVSNQIKRLIDKGFKVYYNKGTLKGSDVNEWFKDNTHTQDEIESIIKKESESGMIAKLNYVRYIKG